MKKKMRAAAAAALVSASLLAGCAGGGTAADSATQDASADKIEVVCATFPAYDWVTQVAGNKADDYEITYLMGSGVDLHSYQPTVDDIAKISNADLFVYVGGESDEWAADAIEVANNADLRTVNMLETVGDATVEEEIVEGMQDEEEEAHGEGEEEGPEYDEHVWLSLRNAQTIVNAISDQLKDIDPDSASAYAANAQAYNETLAELDSRYTDAVKSGAKNTIVFADRFPFRYLADDYGLSYYAAFVGCSAETEASFETVTFLAKKVDELGLSSVFVIEGSDQEIARTVVENTQAKDQQILVMDSLQSITGADAATGKTYYSAMEANLDALVAALA